MRHERYFSSAAGDTSDASTAGNVLGSIHEAESDAGSASLMDHNPVLAEGRSICGGNVRRGQATDCRH